MCGGGGGGGGSDLPSAIRTLKSCRLTKGQKLVYNCTLSVNISFDTN